MIVWQAFYRATLKLIYDGGMAIASNVALSLLLSLFPFLMLIASLVRLYGDPSMAQQVVQLACLHFLGLSGEVPSPFPSEGAVSREGSPCILQSSIVRLVCPAGRMVRPPLCFQCTRMPKGESV